MFVIMYEFNVKKDLADRFTQLWKKLTLLVDELSDSLGARLHKASDTLWIGYAQWPTKDSWENSNLNQKAISELRAELFDVCDDIQIIYQLEVAVDLLATKH